MSTWILCASGPSSNATKDQLIELIHTGCYKGRVIGVNGSPIVYPCDYWLFLDAGVYEQHVRDNYHGEYLVPSYACANEVKGPIHFVLKRRQWEFVNSGLTAIEFARRNGATRIVTSGLDLGGKGNPRDWFRFDGTGYTNSLPYVDQCRDHLNELKTKITILSLDPANVLGLGSISVGDL